MSFPTEPDHPDTTAPDRVLVVASSRHALDLLRWATLRSDDALFVSTTIDAAAQRYAMRFAVETRLRPVADADLDDVSALLLSLDDVEAENQVIRMARRRGVAVHVAGRPLVSDFTTLSLMEQPWPAKLAA